MITLSHFADWLNPMLVKELRQGLRTKLFVGVLISIQLAMMFFVGLPVLSIVDGASELGTTMDGVLWFCLGTVLMFLMPMRGLAAIAEEKKANTLELVQVSRLNSFKIVLGKWLCTLALTLLFVLSVLPYALLRYFIGGIDVVQSLSTLITMMLGSATLTAVCLWLSTMGRAAQGAAVGLGMMLLYGGAMSVVMMSTGMGGGWMGFFAGNTGMGTSLFSAVMTTAFGLALAASRIAAASENHAVVLRGIGLIAGVVGVMLSVVSPNGGGMVVVMPLLLWSIFEAMTERTSEYPAVYRPWALRGVPGRMAGRVLNPGWATGLIYTMLIMGLVFLGTTAGHWTLDNAESRQQGLNCLLLLGAALMPVPLLVWLPRVKQRGALYFVVLLAGMAVFMAARFMETALTKEHAAFVDSMTPVSALAWDVFQASDVHDPHWAFFRQITLPVGGLILLILLFHAVREFRMIRALEKRSIQSDDES